MDDDIVKNGIFFRPKFNDSLVNNANSTLYEVNSNSFCAVVQFNSMIDNELKLSTQSIADTLEEKRYRLITIMKKEH